MEQQKYRVVGSTITHQFTIDLHGQPRLWTIEYGWMYVRRARFEYYYSTGEEGVEVSIRVFGNNETKAGDMGRRRLSAVLLPRQSDAPASALEGWLRSMAAGHAPDYDAQRDELVPITGKWNGSVWIGEWEVS